MERTHRLKDDLAWLPAGVRRTRTVASAAIWAGSTAAFLGAVVAAPVMVAGLWKGFVAGAAGAVVAGDRIGQVMLRRKLRGMARGEIELASLEARADGELVVVEGTVVADETLRGVICDAGGVYRRMLFAAGGKHVHEAAVDFALVDDAGNRILVQAAGARWMAPRRELVTYPRARFQGAPERVQALVARWHEIEALEHVLGAGARVQIVGYKTESADVTGRAVDYRLPPQRATLRSGPELPLVITTVP